MRIKLLLFILFAITFAACNKDDELDVETNSKLTFSTDSVLFDTVFTSIGSTTRRLKIYNKNPNAILINNIKLSGGNSSAFSLNINGQAASSLDLIKINGNDSVNIFVKININPTTENLPFIVQDSILLFFNGNKERIPLVAYGQNANFIINQNISENTTWDSKLPYIIYQSVSVDENVNLIISPGTRILFHRNATMNIKGTLTANGTIKDSILFASDRLEQNYKNEPGQWNGLHFYPNSKNSKINFAVIKNGVAGITVDSLSINLNPKLLLTNTIVKNMEVVGFLGYHTDLTALNNLFTNCGQYLMYGVGGGNYNLKQNTFVSLNLNYPRKTASVYLSDFINGTQFQDLNLEFINNIVWGKLVDEFLVEKKGPNSVLTTLIKNNLLKTSKINFEANGNLLNTDPLFNNSTTENFNLQNISVAVKKGADLSKDVYFNTYLKKDLKGFNRTLPYDIGCYEHK